MQRVPNHPFASYAIRRDASGQLQIECHCAHCGARWKKACSIPGRANSWVFRFAVEHGHGYGPRQ